MKEAASYRCSVNSNRGFAQSRGRSQAEERRTELGLHQELGLHPQKGILCLSSPRNLREVELSGHLWQK